MGRGLAVLPDLNWAILCFENSSIYITALGPHNDNPGR